MLRWYRKSYNLLNIEYSKLKNYEIIKIWNLQIYIYKLFLQIIINLYILREILEYSEFYVQYA